MTAQHFFYDFKENYKKCELELEAIQEERKKEREREEHRALLLDLADKMQNSPYWERQEFFENAAWTLNIVTHLALSSM